jgi:hypothetical protein
VAWIIIAPEILASASWVLLCRTQMTAFMISGSSVANRREMISGGFWRQPTARSMPHGASLTKPGGMGGVGDGSAGPPPPLPPPPVLPLPPLPGAPPG